MDERIGIAVFGATGSVGRQTLDVIQAFPDRFKTVGLAANTNVQVMADLVIKHRPERVVMCDAQACKDLKEILPDQLNISIDYGMDSLDELARASKVDLVVASIVGRSGLRSVMSAVQAGKKVALANKESLVMAGDLVMRECRRTGATILPVDSEHAAVHQLVTSVGMDRIKKVIITASGGPFLNSTFDELKEVTVKQALSHPNWDMGAKISIDSATMMNKGFEIMEAGWLFDLPSDKIDVVIHPESLVHALVEVTDGSLLTQMAEPDMRIPISQALAHPMLLDLPNKLSDFCCLDLTRMGRLTFLLLDPDIFPAVQLCRFAMQTGGDLPAALSVADEVVVDAFLQSRIRFTDITGILSEFSERWIPRSVTCLDDILAVEEKSANLVKEILASRRYGFV